MIFIAVGKCIVVLVVGGGEGSDPSPPWSSPLIRNRTQAGRLVGRDLLFRPRHHPGLLHMVAMPLLLLAASLLIAGALHILHALLGAGIIGRLVIHDPGRLIHRLHLETVGTLEPVHLLGMGSISSDR